MANLNYAPTINFASTSLNGAINDSVDTITLNDTSKLKAPGYLVIDRQDANGTNTPSAREVVSYTGISGSDVTGVTRGEDSSTARSHSDGALVEPNLTVGMWQDLNDFLAVSLATVDGSFLPVSTATITKMEGTNILGSTASITTVNTDTINVTTVDATTVTGVGGQMYWSRSGALATVQAATATDTHFPLIRATKNLTIESTYVSLLSAPSLAAFQFNVSHGSSPTGDFATIYTTKPTIDVGEYDTSTAATASVLSLTSLASGALLKAEIDAHGEAGGMGASLQLKSR